MDAGHHPLVPEQYKGILKDFAYAISAKDMDEAASWFLDMKDNMLDVNNWKNGITEDISFALTDKHKKVLHRKAHTHDMVQLDPDKYQVGDIWSYTLIDTVEYDYDPDTDYESIGMRIYLPCQEDEGLIYNSECASVTFVCDRRGVNLSATCHVRNLKKVISDNVDNWVNVKDEQWQGLIKSFMG